ncbi:MAG: DNA polymerase III subunit gamma/tau [Chloroflexi bacterium]|nr:DNA polymerase III subunit gamma/tau [Chloroflexota bacterium]
MAAQVFYRKWRPQSFAEVVGQEHVTQTLLNALASGRVAHAYLFCGPRGTGKTSMGRILAKAVNCGQNGKGEPCNQCSKCLAVGEGRALDLIEIDAASNRGIDEIRSLREKVNFAPNESKYKVYIIDEVHMLTDPAFNALLKTLEEPPPHTIFVLATTEAHKLPATVISRCQRFDFRRIPLAAVVTRLGRICKAEGVDASEAALTAVARAAGGSLRDASNLLEQITVSHGQKVDLDQIKGMLGIGGTQQARALVAAALKNDIGSGIAAIGHVANEGLDLAQFHRQVMDWLRGLMLVKAGSVESIDVSNEERDELKRMAVTTGMERIVDALRSFAKADMRLATSSLPLELALVEAATPRAQAAPVSAVLSPSLVTAPAKAPAPLPPTRAAAPAPAPFPPQPRAPTPLRPPGLQPPPRPSVIPPPAPQPGRVQPPTPIRESPPPAAKTPAPAQPVAAPPPAQSPGNVATAPGDPLERIAQNWNVIVEASKKQVGKYKFHALLRGARPQVLEGDTVVVGFTHKKFVDMMNEEMDNPASRKVLLQAFEQAAGKPVQVRCVLGGQPPKPARGHLLRAAEEMGAKVVQGGPSQ